MPTLVIGKLFGNPAYSIVPDPSGGSTRKLRQGETEVRITPEQAAKGIEHCSLLYEAGRLA